MEQLNKDWLQKLGVDATEQVAGDNRELRKQALISKLSADREKQAETLLAGSNLKVAKGKKKQNTLDLENRDQTEEFDLDEQRDGYELVDDEQQQNFQKHLMTARIVDQLVREMQAQKSDELGPDGKPLPLFTPEEIRSEIYDPLLRRGLMAETNIPNDYSRTKEMLGASFAAYGERLKKDKLGTGKRLFKENFSLAKTVVTSGLTIASGAEQLNAKPDETNAEMQTSWSPSDNIASIHQGLGEAVRDNGKFATEAMIENTRLGFATQAMSFVTDVAYDGASDISEALTKEPPEVKERIAMAPQLAVALANGASAELVSGFSESGLALELGSTFGSLVDRGAITRQLKGIEFGEEQVKAISGLLAKACQAALLKLDPKLDDSTQQLTTAGDVIVTELHTEPEAEEVAKALEAGAYPKAVEHFNKACKAAVTKALTPKLKALFLRTDVRDKVMVAAADAMDEAFNKPDEDDAPDDVKEAHKAILSHKPVWVHGNSGWVCSVCASSNTEDPAIFAGIVEAKMKQLKADQAKLKWAATLVGMGIDTAANFVAPLAIVGCALKMARNLYEAASRTQDLIKFLDDRQGMFNAASAFSAPVTQFIRNAGMQQAHYYANAGFEAAKMIGAIIQCSGAMAAPAGVVVSAAAGISQAIEAVLYEASKRLLLEVAWNDYKRALARPENRKMGLIALKNNPTLAKYAVAWGAFIKKDPLVADFMDSCGLGLEALKDPDANVDRVVAYLEARMPDDNVVTGRSIDEPAAPWAPAKLELTALSWITVKSLAETRGGVEAQDTLPLEAALKRYAAAAPALLLAAKTKPTAIDPVQQKQQQDWLAQLRQLESLVRAVACTLTDEAGGGNSVEMEEVRAKFVKLVNAQKDIAADWKVPKS